MDGVLERKKRGQKKGKNAVALISLYLLSTVVGLAVALFSLHGGFLYAVPLIRKSNQTLPSVVFVKV